MSPSFLSFFFIYLGSFFILMSFNDFMMIWLSLEMNMISFIMMIYDKYDESNVEGCLKYFFIQAVGSVLFLCFGYMSFNLMGFLGVTVLCYKIGGGPFYFWFPSISASIGWWSCYLLMTFQKIMPLMLISMIFSKVLWVYCFVSLVIGMMGCMGEMDIKKLLAFSSIHHIGWLFLSIIVKDNLWLFYLITYVIMMVSVFMFMEKNSMKYIVGMISTENKFLILLSMLMIGGVPPFLGFFLKWWCLYYIMMYDYSLLMVMIILSVIMFYIYFRLIYDFVLGGVDKMSWGMSLNKSVLSGIDVIILLSFLLGVYFSFFAVS